MKEKEIMVVLHKYDCSQIADSARLKQYDDYTDETIKAARALITEAHKYRGQLIKRMDELLNMDYHTRVTLKRERNIWTKKITYHLTTERVYEDSTARELEHKSFSGAERSNAIKEYENLAGQFPQWEFVKDIDKSPYER